METNNLEIPSWTHEFRHAIKTHEELELFFNHKFPKTKYPIFLPRSFAEKIKKSGLDSILAKEFLPSKEENASDSGLIDPIGDQVHQKTKQLIHRYHNRALFIPTNNCPVICRYCFRKNELYEEEAVFKSDLQDTKNYLLEHNEIEEIIFTGGDPLIISNSKLDQYLEFFKEIPHIKYIRFHSRTPVILPSRIDQELIDLLKKCSDHFKRLILMVHVNHADELGTEEKEALKLLTKNGIEIFSQTVLLKDINDNTETLYHLFKELIDLKITPYYLHHPDNVLGATHFMLSLEDGRKIYQPLRDLLSGWAIPEYIIDIPGGDGKVQAFNPETFQFSGSLINKRGEYSVLFN